MIKKFIAVLATLAFLGGCAGEMSTVTVTERPDGTRVTTTSNVNNSDTAAYYGSVSAHSASEGARVSSMVEDIMQPSGTENPEARAWENAFKTAMIAYGDNLRPRDYSGQKNKTWIDVAYKAVAPLIGAIETATIAGAVVSVVGDMASGGGDTVISQGEGGTVEGSFNKETNEASTLYGDAQVNNPDNSVNENPVTPESEDDSEDVEEVPYSATCSEESEMEGICTSVEPEE